MRKFICKILLIISWLFVLENQIDAQLYRKIFEITPFASMDYFYWGEYNDNSVQIVEEYGFIYSGGISSKIKFSRSFDLYIFLEPTIYYGIVNYNGFLQDANGNTESYKSETAYLGTASTLNFGYDIYVTRKFILAPEFGVQYEYWDRDVDNGGKFGYDEIYNLFKFDFGLNITTHLSSFSKIYLRILGEYPLMIDESIDLASRGQGGPANINLTPNPNIGLNLELGATLYGAFVSGYMNYMIFSKSAFSQNYHQPESDRSLVGLKIGYTF
jgi:hypothetical protein